MMGVRFTFEKPFDFDQYDDDGRLRTSTAYLAQTYSSIPEEHALAAEKAKAGARDGDEKLAVKAKT